MTTPTMTALTAYLSFDGNCREAMSFYRQCFRAELELTAYPDAKGQPSADPAARIMHSHLLKAGAPILMASDMPQPGSLKPGNNVSIAVQCESIEEAERLFATLSHGGEVRMPLMDAPWAARFGMLTDLFGVQWMINCRL
jgi:PhnB protein